MESASISPHSHHSLLFSFFNLFFYTYKKGGKIKFHFIQTRYSLTSSLHMGTRLTAYIMLLIDPQAPALKVSYTRE